MSRETLQAIPDSLAIADKYQASSVSLSGRTATPHTECALQHIQVDIALTAGRQLSRSSLGKTAVQPTI